MTSKTQGHWLIGHCDECNINNTITVTFITFGINALAKPTSLLVDISPGLLLLDRKDCDYVHLMPNVSVFGMDYGDSWV